MKIKGITESQLRAIVKQVSDKKYGGNLLFNREPEKVGNFLHFTLRVNDSSGKGARRSHSGRRMVSACWHAHYDIMSALFVLHPDALLVTALARYDGQDDFNAKFENTGYTNIGSMMQPLNMMDACDCQ